MFELSRLIYIFSFYCRKLQITIKVLLFFPLKMLNLVPNGLHSYILGCNIAALIFLFLRKKVICFLPIKYHNHRLVLLCKKVIEQ